MGNKKILKIDIDNLIRKVNNKQRIKILLTNINQLIRK